MTQLRCRSRRCASEMLLLTLLISGCPQTPPISPQQVEFEKSTSQLKDNSDSQSERESSVSSTTNDSKAPARTKESFNPQDKSRSSLQLNSSENRESDAFVIEKSRRLFKASQSKSAAGQSLEAFENARKAWSLIKDVKDPAAETLQKDIFEHLETVVSELKKKNTGISSDQTRPLLLK